MRKIINLFENHSVSVSGKKGTGKDLLMSNVAYYRRKYYISNADYKCRNSRRIALDFQRLKTGNIYKNFLEGNVKKYVYPYPDGTDIYISDCGIYFPCQYNEKLNKEYEDIINFIALSRQLGDCRVHTNAQSLNRVWDKLREQSDVYIVCQWAKVFGRLAVQKVRIYEKYESAVANVPPCRAKAPLLCSSAVRTQYKLMHENYRIQYGKIEERILVYPHMSKYDTRLFKTILEGGDLNDD